MNEQQLITRLERLAEAEQHPDWTDVLRRVDIDLSGRPHSRAATTPRRFLFSPRRIAVLAALVAAIAALVALLPGWVGRNGHTGPLQGALAAVSQGPVLHAVLQVPADETTLTPNSHPSLMIVDLATGQERPVMRQLELWYDPDRQLVHQIQSIDGTVEFGSLETPSGQQNTLGHSEPASGLPEIDAGLAAFFRGYKQALVDGTATDAGSDTIDGREVEWLHFPQTGGQDVSEEVGVDPDTYQAVALRTVCPRCTSAPPTYTIKTLEGIDSSAADFTAPTPHKPRPVKLYSSSHHQGELAVASTYLGQRAYWVGNSIDGLALDWVEFAQTAEYSSKTPNRAHLIATGRGVTFSYRTSVGSTRDVSPGEPYVFLAETADVGFAFRGFNMEELSPTGEPLTVARTSVPPEGQLALSNVNWWTGQLRKGALYIEIEASSRDLVLAAARALDPTP